jgi:hypothetical protein
MKMKPVITLLSLLILTTFSKSLYAAEGDSTKIRVHDAVHMSWWGEYNQWGVFPAAGTSYRRINLDFTLGCPPVGCSDWDYTVQVEALHKTGALDSNLVNAPQYLVNGTASDTIYSNTTVVYSTFYNSVSGITDSLPAAQFWVMIYDDPANPFLLTDSMQVYPGNYYNYTYAAGGGIVDSVLVGSNYLWINVYTPAYVVYEVVERIELARVITPYGGYYNTSWSNTLHFDITDLAPILQDSVEIRAFYGGWSDGFALTLDFIFIEGTPPRTPVQIRNIYSSGPGGFPYGNTNDPIENYLVPVNMNLSTSEVNAMLRIIPTGHGAGTANCSEFCIKNYRIKLDGIQAFQQQIWRNDCGLNHLQHQAGTWIYDRANWCPGEKGVIKEHEITPFITPGNPISIDMDLDTYTNSVAGQNPNYIMAAQLITFGAPNFTTDASVEEILAPNNDFYYNRYNPICNNPLIVIKNTGSGTLSSVNIVYGIKGATPSVYNWTGTLGFNQSEQVQLNSIDWNSTSNTPDQFYAYVTDPNGITDQYAYNDTMRTWIKFTPQYPSTIVVMVKTNVAYYETTYNIKDDQGNVIFSNGPLSASLIFRDTVVLNPGCYTFNMNDSGKDGLSFFANNDGVGYSRLVNGTGPGVLQFFEADFGTRFSHHFTIGYLLNTPEVKKETIFHLFPNPSAGVVTVDIAFPSAESGKIEIFDALGRSVWQENFYKTDNPVMYPDLSSHPSGIYFVKATTETYTKSMRLVLQ